jgi:hypothetical protein
MISASVVKTDCTSNLSKADMTDVIFAPPLSIIAIMFYANELMDNASYGGVWLPNFATRLTCRR